MNIKEYADVLRYVLKVAIDNQMEAMELPHADERFHDGVICGLQIALGKIDASMFLAENDE